MVSGLDNYTFLDRLVHRIAFSAPGVQLAAADMERAAFRRIYATTRADRPILVTSLPRAGTTLLLTMFGSLPGIATHLYRDMPFVVAPMLWEALSRRFRKQATLAERAHGDGVQIGFDSPEAFEEILWRLTWPDKYAPDRIRLWTADDQNAGAVEFFREHFQKIVSLRCRDSLPAGRYVSKNNGNIGRLEFFPAFLPDAVIVVPVRKPLDQVASLLRQHANFGELHGRNAFSRRYMSDIGHYEFGLLHRPIDFPGFDSLTRGYDSSTADYWLGYWVAAFEYVLRHRKLVTIVLYEDLCNGGPEAIGRIFRRAGVDPGGRTGQIAAAIRAPTSNPVARTNVRQWLLSRAEALYSELAEHAVTRQQNHDVT